MEDVLFCGLLDIVSVDSDADPAGNQRVHLVYAGTDSADSVLSAHLPVGQVHWDMGN